MLVVYLAPAYQELTEVQCDCVDEAGATWGSLEKYFEVAVQVAVQDDFKLLISCVAWRDCGVIKSSRACILSCELG